VGDFSPFISTRHFAGPHSTILHSSNDELDHS
jgi:hypothetical protein